MILISGYDIWYQSDGFGDRRFHHRQSWTNQAIKARSGVVQLGEEDIEFRYLQICERGPAYSFAQNRMVYSHENLSNQSQYRSSQQQCLPNYTHIPNHYPPPRHGCTTSYYTTGSSIHQLPDGNQIVNPSHFFPVTTVATMDETSSSIMAQTSITQSQRSSKSSSNHDFVDHYFHHCQPWIDEAINFEATGELREGRDTIRNLKKSENSSLLVANSAMLDEIDSTIETEIDHFRKGQTEINGKLDEIIKQVDKLVEGRKGKMDKLEKLNQSLEEEIRYESISDRVTELTKIKRCGIEEVTVSHNTKAMKILRVTQISCPQQAHNICDDIVKYVDVLLNFPIQTKFRRNRAQTRLADTPNNHTVTNYFTNYQSRHPDFQHHIYQYASRTNFNNLIQNQEVQHIMSREVKGIEELDKLHVAAGLHIDQNSHEQVLRRLSEIYIGKNGNLKSEMVKPRYGAVINSHPTNFAYEAFKGACPRYTLCLYSLEVKANLKGNGMS